MGWWSKEITWQGSGVMFMFWLLQTHVQKNPCAHSVGQRLSIASTKWQIKKIKNSYTSSTYAKLM